MQETAAAQAHHTLKLAITANFGKVDYAILTLTTRMVRVGLFEVEHHDEK